MSKGHFTKWLETKASPMFEDNATGGAMHSQQPPDQNTLNTQLALNDDSTPIPTSPAQPEPQRWLLLLLTIGVGTMGSVGGSCPHRISFVGATYNFGLQ